MRKRVLIDLIPGTLLFILSPFAIPGVFFSEELQPLVLKISNYVMAISVLLLVVFAFFMFKYPDLEAKKMNKKVKSNIDRVTTKASLYFSIISLLFVFVVIAIVALTSHYTNDLSLVVKAVRILGWIFVISLFGTMQISVLRTEKLICKYIMEGESKMEYEKPANELDIEGNVLDGKISVDNAMKIVSKLTGIESSVLKKGADQYSFIEVIENPSLLEITEEQKETLGELRYILDYKTGVEE